MTGIIVVMILNSNFQMGLIRENILPINYKIIIFSMYAATFIASGIVLLISTYQISNIEGTARRYSFLSVSVIYCILSISMTGTLLQMFLFNSYSELIFYVTSYLSFISSLVFLSILSLKFFRLYLIRKNYLVLFYGLLFAIYCCSLLILFLYLIDGLATHPSVIKPVPPRELIAGKYLVNIFFQSNLAKLYDILFFVSFTLAWFLSVMLLKQYSQRIGKFVFWLLASVPLFFHLVRYEMIFNLSDSIFDSGTVNRIPTSLGESMITTLMNSDIQMSAVFFGFPFLLMALRLKSFQLRKVMIITVIGIMLLFSSRDLHTIFVSSIPPGGVVTISFMVLGSYMLLTSLITMLKIASRDKQLYSEITHRIKNDDVLLKNLVLSEKKILALNMVKPLIDFSIQWQKEHSYDNLSIQEVQQIIQDVTTELREKRPKI